MIDLYIWTTPNGRKASIMLEETGLPYRVHPIDITKNEQFAPDFLRVGPNNKIPAIFDEETQTRMMESGAILLYLARKAGMLVPSEDKAYWEMMEWLMWQMGGFGPMLGQAHHFLRFNAGKAPYAEERFGKEAARLYGVLDRHLAEREYLAGAYSIADIATWPWASRHEWQQVDLNEFPNVKRWYVQIAGRPAVQRGYHVPHYTADIPVPE